MLFPMLNLLISCVKIHLKQLVRFVGFIKSLSNPQYIQHNTVCQCTVCNFKLKVYNKKACQNCSSSIQNCFNCQSFSTYKIYLENLSHGFYSQKVVIKHKFLDSSQVCFIEGDDLVGLFVVGDVVDPTGILQINGAESSHTPSFIILNNLKTNQ